MATTMWLASTRLLSKPILNFSSKVAVQRGVYRIHCQPALARSQDSSFYRSHRKYPQHSEQQESKPCTIATCKEIQTSSLSCHVCVTPATFLHTGFVYETKSSPSFTITEELDTLFQKLTVLVKGHDKAVLDSYEFFATIAAKELGLTLTKVFEPPRNIERLTLLKSVHIFKKHRVQYELRTHYRCLEIARITGSTAQVFLEYIQRNLPEGVAMEITKTAIEKVPEHIRMPLWGDQSKGQTSK